MQVTWHVVGTHKSCQLRHRHNLRHLSLTFCHFVVTVWFLRAYFLESVILNTITLCSIPVHHLRSLRSPQAYFWVIFHHFDSHLVVTFVPHIFTFWSPSLSSLSVIFFASFFHLSNHSQSTLIPFRVKYKTLSTLIQGRRYCVSLNATKDVQKAPQGKHARKMRAQTT